MNAYLVLGIVGGISLLIPIFYLRFRDYRDTRSDTVVHSFDPPKDLSVLEVGYFYDNKLLLKDVLGWIIEYVLKGNLTMKRKGKLSVKVMSKPKNLTEIEKKVWSALFGTEEVVSLDYIKGNYLKKLVVVILQFRKELVKKGYLYKVKNGVWLWALVFALVIGFGLMNVFPNVNEVNWFLKVGGMIVLPFVGMWITLTTPKRTKKGRDLYRRLAGFRHYLKVAEKDREKFRQQLLVRLNERGAKLEFSNLIPYMIVLNVDKKWYETLVPEMQELVDGEDFLGVINSY